MPDPVSITVNFKVLPSKSSIIIYTMPLDVNFIEFPAILIKSYYNRL